LKIGREASVCAHSGGGLSPTDYEES